MSRRKQEVWAEVKTTDGRSISGPIPDTFTTNLRSKLKGWLDLFLIQHATEQGAVITIRLAPAEIDEYANPER